MKLSRREFFKMVVVAAPFMVFSIRVLVKPEPVSTEGTMTLARYGAGTATNQNVPRTYNDDLFILQTGSTRSGFYDRTRSICGAPLFVEV